METPSAPTQPQAIMGENYAFICHGCNILLRQTTSRFQKVEYMGPGRCIGCEFYREDGYLIVREAQEHVEKHREYIKKEVLWDISQDAAATRRRQRELEGLRRLASQ